jgi:hypothetical protein
VSGVTSGNRAFDDPVTASAAAATRASFGATSDTQAHT